MTILSTEDVCIHQATLDDIKYIIELKIEKHHNLEKFYPVDHLLNDLFLREYKKRWEQKIHSGMRTLIISVQGNKVGFISYMPCTQRDPLFEDIAEINQIYLIPAMRSRQFGKLLFTKTIDDLKQDKCRKVIVWLDENRRQTRRFYEAMGFQMTSLIRTEVMHEQVILRENMYQLMLS
jgi:L-amino acid N-acyltransferase YncA